MHIPSFPRLALACALAAILAAPAAAAPVRFDCVADPAKQIRVGSPVTGILREMKVSRGDRVSRGEPLAQMDSEVEEASVELDRVRAASTEDIEAQKTRIALAETRLGRAKQLAAKGHAPQEQVDALQADYDVGQRELARLVQQRRIAELELARSEASLAQRTIRSPIDALVITVEAAPGEFIQQETSLLTLVQLDPLYVETFVPVDYWGQLAVGDTGTVTLAEPIGGSYPAEVTVVDRVFDAASNTFGVRLELANPGHELPAGQRCEVAFDLPELPALARGSDIFSPLP